jgi:hypothetical protein
MRLQIGAALAAFAVMAGLFWSAHTARGERDAARKAAAEAGIYALAWKANAKDWQKNAEAAQNEAREMARSEGAAAALATKIKAERDYANRKLREVRANATDRMPAECSDAVVYDASDNRVRRDALAPRFAGSSTGGEADLPAPLTGGVAGDAPAARGAAPARDNDG